MNRIGSALINRANEISVNVLRHKGDKGRRDLCHGNKAGVKGHICVNLIGRHILYPEALTGATNIPVRELVNKVVKNTGSLGDLVIFEVVINRLNSRVELGEYPLIHYREAVLVKGVLGRIKAVDISVKNVERIGVPKRSHKLSLSLNYRIAKEAVRKPGRGVGVEIPADSVCAVLFKRLKGVDRITLGLGHLLSVLVENVAENENVLVGRAIKDKRGDRHKRIEPTAGLVNALADEVCGELALEELLILKGVVPLCKGHRAGVKPTVDNLGNSLHLAAALGTLKGDRIDKGAVKLDILGAIIGHALKLLDRADGVKMSAGAFPNVEGGAPISVS